MMEIFDDFIHEEKVGCTVENGIGEIYYGVFRYDGKLYRCRFVKASAYYRSAVGEWEDPFYQSPDYSGYFDCGEFVETITCEEVVEKLVVSYEPVS
jgi:hypothetical protein